MVPVSWNILFLLQTLPPSSPPPPPDPGMDRSKHASKSILHPRTLSMEGGIHNQPALFLSKQIYFQHFLLFISLTFSFFFFKKCLSSFVWSASILFGDIFLGFYECHCLQRVKLLASNGILETLWLLFNHQWFFCIILLFFEIYVKNNLVTLAIYNNWLYKHI